MLNAFTPAQDFACSPAWNQHEALPTSALYFSEPACRRRPLGRSPWWGKRAQRGPKAPQALRGQLEPPKELCQPGLELGGAGGKGADAQPPSFPFQALQTVMRTCCASDSAVSQQCPAPLAGCRPLLHRPVYFLGFGFSWGPQGRGLRVRPFGATPECYHQESCMTRQPKQYISM